MGQDLYKTVQPPLDTWTPNASRNNANGTDADALERCKIREICEGWGAYRDAAEWKSFRSMFHDDAYIATSWSQGPIDSFIEASKQAFADQSQGMFYILHRINVTITCRATIDGIEMDNEADCRFFFLLEKRGGRWGVVFYTLLFDKDKMVPVNPTKGCSEIPEEEVEKYPS